MELFVESIECVKNGERQIRNAPARENGISESGETVCNGSEGKRNLSGEREEFPADHKQEASLLLVADEDLWKSNHGRVSDKYFSFVPTFLGQRCERNSGVLL